MKYLLLTIILIAATLLVEGQTQIKNSFSSSLEITFPGRGPITIPANETRQVNELATGEIKNIRCRYQENGRTKTYRTTKVVVSGKMVFGPSDLTPTSNNPSVGSVISGNAQSDNAKKETAILQRIQVVDSSKNRFYVLGDGHYAGISLKPGQISDPIDAPLGLNQITIMVDMDPEGKSTGRNFAQAVVKFIVVDNQSLVVIKESNITKLAGGSVKINLKSALPYKIVFVSKGLEGRSLRPGLKLKKLDLFYGFNTFSVQYLDGGVKYQADLETIIAEGDFNVTIGTQNLKNIVKLSDGYGTF